MRAPQDESPPGEGPPWRPPVESVREKAISLFFRKDQDSLVEERTAKNTPTRTSVGQISTINTPHDVIYVYGFKRVRLSVKLGSQTASIYFKRG